jgi:hypothetical protein
MNRRKDGIRKCKVRLAHDYEPKERGYDDRDKIPADLEAWSGLWHTWWAGVGEEVKKAFEQFDSDQKKRERYYVAVDQLIKCGTKMKQAGCELLNNLHGVYEPEDSASPAEGGGVITDSTQPPPPPFGKGHL